MKKERVGKIYTLSCINGNVFYVGCTVMTIESRLMQHIYEAKRYIAGGKTGKSKAIHIHSLGYDVYATIIDTMPVMSDYSFSYDRKLAALESEWIEKYIDAGAKLLNDCVIRGMKLKPVNQVVGQSVSAIKLMDHTRKLKSA